MNVNSLILKLHRPITYQLIRFGFVGVLAAMTNFVAVVILVSLTHLHPLVANIFAFLIAFQVSFHGHKFWTFSTSEAKHLSSMTKFFIVAVASFFLNEALFALFLQEWRLYYMLALFLTLMIVPRITFTFSKLWAFR